MHSLHACVISGLITSFITSHAGGQPRIISNCGKDASSAFNSVRNHGSTARAQRATLLVGQLSQ